MQNNYSTGLVKVINDNSFVTKKYMTVSHFSYNYLDMFHNVCAVSYLIASQFCFKYNMNSGDMFCHVENQGYTK